LSKDQIEAVIDTATGWYRVLFSLLAGTGMRVGKALALEISDVQGNVLRVHQSLYQRRLDTTKTEAGEKEIDLAPELAEMIQAHVGTRLCGLVFKGGLLIQRNVLRMLHRILKRLDLPSLCPNLG
jgi:integrase